MGFVRQSDYDIKHKELDKKINDGLIEVHKTMDDRFAALVKQMAEDRKSTDGKITAMQKTIWVATGFCAAIAFLSPILLHIFWN
jgi:hypothetical protein